MGLIVEGSLCARQGLGSTAEVTSWSEYYALRRLPLQSPVGISAPRKVHPSICLMQVRLYTEISRRHSCMHGSGMTATLTVVLTVQPWS